MDQQPDQNLLEVAAEHHFETGGSQRGLPEQVATHLGSLG